MPQVSDNASAVHAKPSRDDIVYPAAVPFLLVHLGCLAAVWTGVTWRAAAIGVVLYVLRIFAIGAGYHRYFSHRAFSTSRGFQFVLAVLAQSSAQSSVLWWAARHRDHHLHSDTAQDIHSPRHRGFLYAHLGWIFDKRHSAVDPRRIADFAQFPELRWLQRFEYAPAALLALACFALAGWSGLVVGFLWSTVAVYHATFCINSLAHTHGRQRYVTGDTSRNNLLLAILTMGEGWHNNHHAYQSSARQGFRPWEVDLTYYILRGLCRLGVVWDLKAPPQEILRNEHRLGARVIARSADELALRYDPETIARAIMASLQGSDLIQLRAALAQSTQRLGQLSLPQIPSRQDLLALAEALFVQTVSVDAIVDQAHDAILSAVGARLMGATPLSAVPAAGLRA